MRTIKRLVGWLVGAKRAKANRCLGGASCRNTAEASKENKPLILRQGSPECFDGLPLKVSWNITENCNFRCSYCITKSSGYDKVFCTLEQAKAAVRYIASANRPSYMLTIVGGEPTTHPHFAEIITLLCDWVGDRLTMLEIITNGSFKTKQFEAILKASECHFLKLVISIHLEYMSVETVAELVKRLSCHVCLQINLMYHPKLEKEAEYMAETLCDLRKSYPFHSKVVMLMEPPRYDKYDGRYTKTHYDWAKKTMEKFNHIEKTYDAGKNSRIRGAGTELDYVVDCRCCGITEQHAHLSCSELEVMTGNAFTGMTCVAGSNVLWIKGGQARGMVCMCDKPACNIYEENPFEREDWIHGVVCTKRMCGCNVNYRIPKFRSPEDAERFIAEKRGEQKRLKQEYEEKGHLLKP